MFEENLAEARAAQNLSAKAKRPVVRESRAEAVTKAGPVTHVPVSEVALKLLRDFRQQKT